MTTVDRILLLLEDRKITKNKILQDLNLSKNSFVNWKQRGTSPQGDTLSRIADYLDVSVDYLLGREEIKKAPSVSGEGVDASSLSPEALAFFEKLRRVEKKNPDFLDLLQKMLDNMLGE